MSSETSQFYGHGVVDPDTAGGNRLTHWGSVASISIGSLIIWFLLDNVQCTVNGMGNLKYGHLQIKYVL